MQYPDWRLGRRSRFELAGFPELISQSLLAFYLVLVIISLYAVEIVAGATVTPTWAASLGTASLLCLLPIFSIANFSFGYLLSVAFFGTVAGFVWLSYFSSSQYDHAAGRWSAIASLFAFLVPIVFQVQPAKRKFVMVTETMDACIRALLILAVAILLLNFNYGFAFVGLHEAGELRGGFARPALLNYATNNVVYAVLPFAFAFYAQRGSKVMAATSLLLLPCFYPVLLNKTVLFAGAWLPFIFLVFRYFDPKQASVISLAAPLLLGLLLHFIGPSESSINQFVFGYVNERMFAVPSIAMDYYADFFSSNPKTYFCQINIIRLIAGCHYSNQLGVVFAARYGVGNLNASLFATEGIASVGLLWMPVVMFLCGMVLSIGNSCSRHLPAPMMATSGALALQALQNVALSTALLTNGVMLLFLIWYVCPEDRAGRGRQSTTLSDAPADVCTDCIFDGTPLRFRSNGMIDAIVDDRVVVFDDWEELMKFLRR
ncbi:hypothetical protein [Bradyrhizobium lablabi]|uniref:hypothetical protein n=1 Tax=Bradyrhizobium lablabi TaxID=722472 RepID=UPI001BABF29A|nr:hypothetical protein [Bradyrhizobium lablabi]MBR0693276.1 hypothetical protein [Bradyrhizobium lablabi]